MKNLLLFITFSLFAVPGYSQPGIVTDSVKTKRPPGMWLSESKKIDELFDVRFVGLAIVDLFIEKATHLPTKKVYKNLLFTAKTSSGSLYNSSSVMYNGLLYEQEIDEFITALEYIQTTLLPSKPGNKVSYTLLPSKSTLGITATFNPYDGAAEGDWDISMLFTDYTTYAYVTVKNKDFKTFITTVKLAKEKLNAF